MPIFPRLIEIKVQEPVEDAWYNGTIGRLNEYGDPESYYEWFEMDENHIIRIPVHSEIEPGQHVAIVECGGVVGQDGNRGYVEITVTVGEAVIALAKDEVEVHEFIRGTVIHAPGAVEITTTVNELEDWEIGDWDNVWQFGPWGGEYVSGDGLEFEQIGTYTLKLYARYSDEGDWVDTGVSKTVRATGDEYDPWAMYCDVERGEISRLRFPKITGSWANVWDDTTGAQIYWMNWEYDRNSEYDFFDMEREVWVSEDGELPERDNGSIYIPSEYLKANHTYHIDYHFWGRGIEAEGVGDVKFFVAPDGNGHQVTLTVIKPEADRNVYVFEDFQVIVEAEGATAIRAYDGWNWHYAAGDRLEEEWSDGSEGTRSLYAQAYYGDDVPWVAEGFNWSEWNWEKDQTGHSEAGWEGISNIVEITFERWGQMDPPNFQVLHDNIPVGGGFIDDIQEPEDAWHNGTIGRLNEYGDPRAIMNGSEMDENHIIRIPA